MSESFNRRGNSSERLGIWGGKEGNEPPSVDRLTHFIISLSHIYSMREWVMAIVKQAYVKTQHKGNDNEMYEEHT